MVSRTFMVRRVSQNPTSYWLNSTCYSKSQCTAGDAIQEAAGSEWMNLPMTKDGLSCLMHDDSFQVYITGKQGMEHEIS